MKIGVALSGCDIGGISGYRLLCLLEDMGLDLHMISVSGTPSIAALLYKSGWSEKVCHAYLDDFLQNRRIAELDTAIDAFSEKLSDRGWKPFQGLVINAVHIADGSAAAFTNDMVYRAGNLRTFPLNVPYHALSATIGAVDGLGNYPYQGCKLCDYAIQHGCPFYPLRLASCDMILSFSFLPQIPQSPYDISLKNRIEHTCHAADFHFSFQFPPESDKACLLSDWEDLVTGHLEEQMERLLYTAAFGR